MCVHLLHNHNNPFSPTTHTDDVPKCGHGVPGCSLDNGTWVHTITGNFRIKGSGRPVVAHLHCHAPTCLSMTVYNNDTGALLCEEKAVYGDGDSRNPFGEVGYIAVPPCVWGSPDDGLEAPPDLTGVNYE